MLAKSVRASRSAVYDDSMRACSASAPCNMRSPLTGSFDQDTVPFDPSRISPTAGRLVTVIDLLALVWKCSAGPPMAMPCRLTVTLRCIVLCAFQASAPPIAAIESARIASGDRRPGAAGAADVDGAGGGEEAHPRRA